MFLAEHRNDLGKQEQVAVKLVKASASTSDKEEFLGEAELMLTFDHPHVWRVRCAVERASLSVVIKLIPGC